MSKGVYSGLSDIIKDNLEKGKMVIDVVNLASQIDVSELSREELEVNYKRAAASVALYQNGFRSVVRGSGLFLYFRGCDNPFFLNELAKNANLDAAQKEQVARMLEELKAKNIETLPYYAQFVFDFDPNGDAKIYTEITRDELIAMLRKEAEAV